MKKAILALFIMVACIQVNAQVFLGVGYAETHFFGESALDAATGVSLMIEKDINLSASGRWKMHPNLHVSFLFSNYGRAFQPIYLNIISLSPKVSYEVISNKKIKVAPYGNPFVSFLLGLQSGDPVFFESETIDQFKGGIEIGLRIDLISDKTTIRIIPVAAQLGRLRSLYRQGMISLMFRI